MLFGIAVGVSALIAATAFVSVQRSEVAGRVERDAERLVAASSLIDSAVAQTVASVQVAQSTADPEHLSESLSRLPILSEVVTSVVVEGPDGEVLGALVGGSGVGPEVDAEPIPLDRRSESGIGPHPEMVAAAGHDPVVVDFVAAGTRQGTTIRVRTVIPIATVREVAGIDADTRFEVTLGEGAGERTLLRTSEEVPGERVERTVVLAGRALRLAVWSAVRVSPFAVAGIATSGGALAAMVLAMAHRLLVDTRRLREEVTANAALEMALGERRRGELRLQSANARAQAVLECVPDTVVALDGGGGRCTLLNRTNLLGVSAAEIAEAGLLVLVHSQDRTRVAQLLGRDDADGLSVKFRAHDRHGNVRYLVLRVSSAVPGLMGGPPSRVALVSDVTEQHHQREREAALRRAMQETQRLEALGRLAGGIAHDFGNILSTVRIQAEVLQMSGAGDGTEEAIIQAVRQAEALVRQLLAFARRDVGPPTDVDVDEQIRSMEALIRTRAGSRIETVLELDADGIVRADPTQIDQVVLNLVGNACDAMPDGGRLVVRTSIVGAGSGEIGEFAPAHVRIEVGDTGEGMSAATKARVFEPFFTTKGEGGTGLGLATVQSIVDGLGGTIRVDSALGEGTTFTVLVPLASRREVRTGGEGISGFGAWMSTMPGREPAETQLSALAAAPGASAERRRGGAGQPRSRATWHGVQ